jgi:transposase
MLRDQNNQLSIYSILYNKIPENHTLKLLDNAIDFRFITKSLEQSYNKFYGRPAKHPELMLKLLILQYLYNLSDERVIEESSLNLAYMWFLGINPDETLPDPSLLSKFRVHRLQEVTLDEIIVEIVKQCVEKGIIEDTGISIDATHTKANTFKATPERVIKRLAKKIFKTYEKEVGSLPEEINQNIPDYKEISDNKEAKRVMKNYLESEINKIESAIILKECPNTRKILENAKQILEDPKFIEQRGVRSIVDQDARVGHKSKTDHFFGYKDEYIITTENRIITAITVADGAYVDGTRFNELIELTKKSGLEIKEVYGDKAYFKKPILDKINEIDSTPYIPVSEMAYKIDEERFGYNKDSDEWFCNQGNKTSRKRHRSDKSGKQTYKYYFEKSICKNCTQRQECIKSSSTIARILEVGINTPEFYGYSQQQKTKEFHEKYKKRACQEWKNGEMKNFHGLDRARGYGLGSMSKQAKLTAIAVNLKRIAAILSSKLLTKLNISLIIFDILTKRVKFNLILV